jgi:hypothetical protein
VIRRAAALLVMLAACTGATDPPAAPRPTGTVTQVLTFQAFDDAGLLPHLVRGASLGGTCPGGSRIHTGRFDAWRCQAGETSFDPCFSNQTGEELACVSDPWAREVTIVRPPAPLGRAGANRNDPGLPPWFLELADGGRCGRTPPSTYRCAGGADVGEPDTTRPMWTVRPAGGAGVSLEVATAWY